MGKLSFAERIKNLFSSKKVDTEDFFEDLTDTLIEGDIGAKTAFEITEQLEKICKEKKLSEESEKYLKPNSDDNFPDLVYS